jgi:pSer/pThr/pTyr-binding forkhead associated (FHA) protein
LIEDLGSSNGTWCNGVRCRPFEAVPVRFGDELLFADERFHLEAPQPAAASDS